MGFLLFQHGSEQRSLCEAPATLDWSQWIHFKVNRTPHKLLRTSSGKHSVSHRALPRPQTGTLTLHKSGFYVDHTQINNLTQEILYF